MCDTTHFTEYSSYHILAYDQQEVSDTTHLSDRQSHQTRVILFVTASELMVVHVSNKLSHLILSYDHQEVSSNAAQLPEQQSYQS